jgi:hypothetical protein
VDGGPAVCRGNPDVVGFLARWRKPACCAADRLLEICRRDVGWRFAGHCLAKSLPEPILFDPLQDLEYLSVRLRSKCKKTPNSPVALVCLSR